MKGIYILENEKILAARSFFPMPAGVKTFVHLYFW